MFLQQDKIRAWPQLAKTGHVWMSSSYNCSHIYMIITKLKKTSFMCASAFSCRDPIFTAHFYWEKNIHFSTCLLNTTINFSCLTHLSYTIKSDAVFPRALKVGTGSCLKTDLSDAMLIVSSDPCQCTGSSIALVPVNYLWTQSTIRWEKVIFHALKDILMNWLPPI